MSTSQNGQDILVHLGDIKLILVDRYERWAAQHPEEAAAVDAGLNVRVESRADQYPDYHESSWRGYEAVGPHNVVEQKTSAYHDRPQMGPASSSTKENPERPPSKWYTPCSSVTNDITFPVRPQPLAETGASRRRRSHCPAT